MSRLMSIERSDNKRSRPELADKVQLTLGQSNYPAQWLSFVCLCTVGDNKMAEHFHVAANAGKLLHKSF